MGMESRENRIHRKGLICIGAVAILLLLLFLRIAWKSGENGRQEEVSRDPVIEELKNVWIMGVGISEITLFCQGNTFTYKAQEQFLREEYRDQVGDVTLTDGRITALSVKKDKLHGAVLAIGEEYVEVEGYGKLGLLQDCQGYRLYDVLKMIDTQDLIIGYDNADFVMENGGVCAILLARQEQMEKIRVLIKTEDFTDIFHERLEITGDTEYMVSCGEETRVYQPGEVVTFEPGDKWSAGEERIKISPCALTGKLAVVNLRRSQGSPAYRGELEISAAPEGLVMINQVALEEYLYSVVPSEMPPSYPAEALKAQAVCARTYAYGRLLRAGYPDLGAHVDDSTSFQVYNNGLEASSTTQAVKETYGQLLFTPQGECAQTYYYSTSCGVGTDATVWATAEGNAPGYLKSKRISRAGKEAPPETPEFLLKEDPGDYEADCAWYRWSYTVAAVDQEALKGRIQTVTGKEQNFEHLFSMEITERGPGGIATELTMVTDQGSICVKGESVIRRVLCDGVTRAVCRDGKERNCIRLLPSAFFILTTSQEGENVLGYSLAGGGYGHGIGMSQNGACEMAREGMGVQEILSFFYEGCQLKKLY